MPIWMKLLLWIITLSVLCVGILLLFGVTDNKNKSAQQINRLIQLTSTEDHTKIAFSRFKQLPPPVARYFQLVLRDGQPLIQIARFSQKGELRINEKRNGIMVPMEGEVGWHLPDGSWSFWKGNIIQINYDFMQ